jgi:hypothetical protein
MNKEQYERLKTMNQIKEIMQPCLHNWRLSYSDESKERFWYCSKCRRIEKFKDLIGDLE